LLSQTVGPVAWPDISSFRGVSVEKHSLAE
jgi:hypothetical protein